MPLTQVSVPAGVIEAVRARGRPVAFEAVPLKTAAGGHLAKLSEPVAVPEGDSLTVTLGLTGRPGR
ncbi:MAG TPA: hypothetical protein VKU77_27035 [Streptosporangiaceae bacterium]|nr:hypothetical protein [Streptosporangiaceae bacterium]